MLSAGAPSGISAPAPRPTAAMRVACTAIPIRSAASHLPRCGNRPPESKASPTPASRTNSATGAPDRSRPDPVGSWISWSSAGIKGTASSPISASPRAASMPSHHLEDLRAPPTAPARAGPSVLDVQLMTASISGAGPGCAAPAPGTILCSGSLLHLSLPLSKPVGSI
jgi:hypothetical protein